MNNIHEYDDIINLSRPETKCTRMPAADRAAQFSPFAALTGYDEAVKETARVTDERTELDENELESLNDRLRYISENKNALISVTYFKPDTRKSGGEYITVTGTVRKVDTYKGKLIMADKSEIPIREILSIEIESEK